VHFIFENKRKALTAYNTERESIRGRERERETQENPVLPTTALTGLKY
jgi:hypothetical protein